MQTDRIGHTTAFATPVVVYWLEREITQWVSYEGSIRRPITLRCVYGYLWKSLLDTDLSGFVVRVPVRYLSDLQVTERQAENAAPVGEGKEMFYLTTHSTHFIYGYTVSDIWLRTIQIVRGNPLPPHRLLFSINSKGSFICTIPQTG